MDKIDILNRTQTIFTNICARFALLYLQKYEDKDPKFSEIMPDQVLEKLSFPLIISVFIMNKSINIVNFEKEPKEYTEEEYAIFVDEIEREFITYYDNFVEDDSILKSKLIH